MFADQGSVWGIAELAMKRYTLYFEQRRRGFDSGFCVKRNSLPVGRKRRKEEEEEEVRCNPAVASAFIEQFAPLLEDI